MSAQPPSTALLDALIARNLSAVQQQAAGPPPTGEGGPPPGAPPPLEGYPALPNPDPNSPPPLYGEPPGEGYMYAHDPETRQRAMVTTTPEVCREMMLRTMEMLAQNAGLPFNEEGSAKNAEAILKIAQAYLLIDPAVDAQGVPIGAQQAFGAAQQLAVAHGSPPPPTPAPAGKGAHGTVKPGKQVGGATLPPKVLPGAAGQMIQQMHENAETVLRGDRGSRPLPQPRVGA